MAERFDRIVEGFGRYTNILVVVFTVFLLVSLYRNWNRIERANEKVEEKNKEVQKLEENKKQLELRIQEAESTKYIEKQIRDNLGLAKEGEVVIVLPDDQILRELAPNDIVVEEEQPKTNLQKWVDLFR